MKAIVDELFDWAHICLDEHTKMVTDTVQEYAKVPDSCSKCGGSLGEIYVRSEKCNLGNGYDLIVLKCERCGLFHAFWIQPFTYEPFFSTPAKEDIAERIIEPPRWKYKGKPQWGEGKQPKFSKKTAKNYKRAVSQLDHLSKKLNTIIQGKLEEMYRAGLSFETINSARNIVANYLRTNSATSKRLVSLFAAAIYEVSHKELAGISRFGRTGEKISERQLEKIFGVTRKTIRKWRKCFTCT